MPDAAARSELETVLASDLFVRSERLTALLRFVVEETLDGPWRDSQRGRSRTPALRQGRRLRWRQQSDRAGGRAPPAGQTSGILRRGHGGSRRHLAADGQLHPSGCLALHGYILAWAGRRYEALGTLAELRRLASPRTPSPFLTALVYVGLEDSDRAFEWLEKAFEGRSWELPVLKMNPVFDVLRSDPRFPVLLDHLGLPR